MSHKPTARNTPQDGPQPTSDHIFTKPEMFGAPARVWQHSWPFAIERRSACGWEHHLCGM
jgi:hypothetical protein